MLALGSVYTTDMAFTILAQASTSNFQSGKYLEGKRVMTPTPNDLGQLGVRAWVDAHGGDSSKVIFVHGIPVPEVPAALAEHRVDASETTEPQWTAQKKEGKVKLLAKNFDAIAPRFVNGAFFARREWVESHREEARLFTQAMSETAQWAKSHPDEAIELSTEAMKSSKAEVEFRARVPLGEGLWPELVQPVLDVAARYGMISPLRAQDLFNAQ
jgi:NitT/TauT family transport system substrate-binding protein